MQHVKLFINRAIDNEDYTAFARYGITIDDMHSETDRNTFRFIEKYARENGGKMPSYATVTNEVEGFEYIPGVSDSYEYLAGKAKDFSARQEIVDLINTGEFERKLEEMGGREFLDNWLQSEIESIKMRTHVRHSVGTDIKDGGEKFLDEYMRRKVGESFRVWKSKFSSIEQYVSGNVYTVFGKSGRGKSVITLEDALYAAQQGANVLIWAMEMSLYEVLVRAYVSLSGDMNVATTMYEGIEIEAGFDADEVRSGGLSEKSEEDLRGFLRLIDGYVEGNVYIRAVDDEDFIGRDLRALESDIERIDADFVVIDPFYYMDYEANTSRTAGGGAAETSIKLRALAGRTRSAIIAITQAEETEEEQIESSETRELKLPARKDVTKTKALLQDAYQLIAVDTDYRQGRGLVGVLKGRDGGEGNISEIRYLPQYGIVDEMATGEDVVKNFEF